MVQKSLLAALLLHGLQGSHGFVSNNARASLRPRTTRATTYSLPKEEKVAPIAGVEPPKSDENEPVLLEQLLNSDITSAAEIAAAAPLLVSSTSSVVVPPPDLVDRMSREEDVKAILVASGQAAAEAEASMPPELKQQLAFTAKNTNATTSSLVVEPLEIIESVPDILTAASVVGEPVTKIQPPKVSKILKFAIPAIGVWLCGPLLSLIDTSAVGLFSGTVQQAALSPAVAVTDYAALLIVSE